MKKYRQCIRNSANKCPYRALKPKTKHHGALPIVNASQNSDGSFAGEKDRSSLSMRSWWQQTVSHRLVGFNQQHGLAGIHYTWWGCVPLRRLSARHCGSVDSWTCRESDGTEEGMVNLIFCSLNWWTGYDFILFLKLIFENTFLKWIIFFH